MGVVGCLLGIHSNYLNDRQKYLRVHSTSSKVLENTSGLSQGSMLGPLLFCKIINDLPDVLMFSRPSIFGDGL